MSDVGPWDTSNRFRRLNLPAFFSPVRNRRRPVYSADLPLDGIRMYSDDPLLPGDVLAVELFLPGRVSVRCVLRVAWVMEMPSGAPAAYDIGFLFRDIRLKDYTQIAELFE
jgi:PilZ domain-containing protein